MHFFEKLLETLAQMEHLEDSATQVVFRLRHCQITEKHLVRSCTLMLLLLYFVNASSGTMPSSLIFWTKPLRSCWSLVFLAEISSAFFSSEHFSSSCASNSPAASVHFPTCSWIWKTMRLEVYIGLKQSYDPHDKHSTQQSSILLFTFWETELSKTAIRCNWSCTWDTSFSHTAIALSLMQPNKKHVNGVPSIIFVLCPPFHFCLRQLKNWKDPTGVMHLFLTFHQPVLVLHLRHGHR